MEILHETLKRLKIGEPQRVANLIMIPLIGDHADKPTYATLDDALAEGWVEVTEVSSFGSVPALKLRNRGERDVLIMDGEELIGAKQNRVLNLTILAPAGKSLELPVSCVEQGRWTDQSRTFGTSPHLMYARGRAQKMDQVSESLRSSGTRASDQGRVWEDIARKSRGFGVHSATGAMSDIYERESRRVEEYVHSLVWTEGQAGAVFVISARPVGLDLFSYPDTMRRLLPKLVRSYALDAVEARGDEGRSVPLSSVEDFLAQIAESRVETSRAIGRGEDLRLSAPHITGAGLAYHERLIHLSAFRTGDPHTGEDPTGTRRGRTGQLMRASLRRWRS